MIEFRYLPAFFAVAECKSFTEAGKKLYIATSAVSRQIQLLEEACDVQLFFRSSREATLTPEGKRLFEEMRHFQAQANKIVDRNAVTTFRIGVLQGVLQHWFIHLVTKAKFFRNMNIEIRVGAPDKLAEWVSNGEVDATFFSSVYSNQIPSSLQIYRLFREDIVLISQTKVNLYTFEEYTWICFSLNTWITRFAAKEPERYILVNNMGTIVNLVRAGMGIAMVPSYVLGDPRGLYVQPVKKFAREYISLLTRRYDREPPALTEFKKLLQSSVNDWKELQ